MWSFKELIFGGPLWRGPRGRWHPQTLSKYLFVKYLLMSKKRAPYFKPTKKLIFAGSILGASQGVVPPNDVITFFS